MFKQIILFYVAYFYWLFK